MLVQFAPDAADEAQATIERLMGLAIAGGLSVDYQKHQVNIPIAHQHE